MGLSEVEGVDMRQSQIIYSTHSITQSIKDLNLAIVLIILIVESCYENALQTFFSCECCLHLAFSASSDHLGRAKSSSVRPFSLYLICSSTSVALFSFVNLTASRYASGQIASGSIWSRSSFGISELFRREISCLSQICYLKGFFTQSPLSATICHAIDSPTEQSDA